MNSQAALLLLVWRSDETCSLLMALPMGVLCFRDPVSSS